MIFNILSELADGKFHSGEQLAQQFKVSRARIWQAIVELRALGLDIAAVTGRGYKIFDGLELLDKEKIIQQLPAALQNTLPDPIIYLQTTSTNEVLSEGLRNKNIVSGTVCLAEYQSSGRGRLGRQWVSPLASNVYCSMAWQFQLGAAQLMGLSLVMGIAVVEALAQVGIKNIGLKWPNDIFYQGKKLGGILVEMAGDALGPCEVVVGVGLNVRMPRSAVIDQAYTDLSHTDISRNQLTAALIATLHHYLSQFNQAGLAPFLTQWYQYDMLHQQMVDVIEGDIQLSGVVTGIDEQGQLKVNIDGIERSLTSAQVSVRLRGG